MTKVDKLLDKWLENTPTDAPIDSVKAILDRFFPNHWDQKGSSHIVVWDKKLIGLPGYGPKGDFSIPVKGGQKVKGFYLKRLSATIKLLEETGK